MPIRTRLLAFALISVVLVCAAGYLGIANGRHVRETQRETVLNSGPVFTQLATIKFSGLRIISAATDFGLFRLEDPIRNAPRMRNEEGEILDATRQLNDSLEKTRVVWERAGWDPAEIVRMIEIKVSYDHDLDFARVATEYWAPLALSPEQKRDVEDPIELERLADEDPSIALRRFIVSDDPDEIVERIAPYVERGFDNLVFHAPGNDQRRFLDQFCADVVPLLRERFSVATTRQDA